MANPFDIDESEIPVDSRTQTLRRRLRVVGFGLWGLFVGGLVVVMVSDTGELSSNQAVPLGVLSIGTSVAAIVLGVLALFVLRYLPSIVAQLVFGILFMLGLLVILPAIVSMLVDNISLFDTIPEGSEQNLLDFVDELLA